MNTVLRALILYRRRRFINHLLTYFLTYLLTLSVCVYTVSYTMDTMYFTWMDKPLELERNLQLPQFALRSYVQHDCSQNYTAGRYRTA